MDDAVGAKLRELLTPSVRDELLDDPRRLAELVRERLGADRKREASFLNTVMQEGVPKRLLAMPSASLTSAMIANYARKVSEDTGLKEEVARSAIEAWSVGLGLTTSASKPRADSGPGPELNQRADTSEDGKPREAVSAGTGADIREVRWIGVLMAIFGVAAFLVSNIFHWEGAVLRQALPIFTVATANVYAGLALVLICYSPPTVHDVEFMGVGLGATSPLRRVRRITIAVCATDAIVLCLCLIAVFAFAPKGGPRFQSGDILPFIGLVGGAILFPAITFRLYRWRAATPVAATLNLLDPVAILLLVRGLFGLWVFGMNASPAGGLTSGMGWLLAELPFDLAMIFMSVAIFIGSPRLAPRVAIAAVCSVSAILYGGDLWSYQDQGWEWKMLDETGIIVDLLVLGLVIFGYIHRRNDVAQAV